MLSSSAKKVFISVMRYYFDTTQQAYPAYQDMLLQWDKCSSQQSENYAYWLFARCLETLNSRGISGYETCLAYKDTLTLYLNGEQDEQSEFIGNIWQSQARAYLSSHCPNPDMICDISGTMQALYPNLPVICQDDLLKPLYMGTRVIITANSTVENLRFLTQIADIQVNADLYILLYGSSDWIIAENNSLSTIAQAYNSKYKYLSGFCTESNILFTIFRHDCSGAKNNYILDRLEFCNQKILNIGKKLVRKSKISLLKWQIDKSATQMIPCPLLVSPIKASSELTQEPEGTIAHISLNTQASRDATWYAYPIINHETIAITRNNYWQCVVSHGIRSALSFVSNSRLDISSIQAPEESLPEYQTFKADSLALMLFGYNAYGYSYRNLQVGNIKYTRNNKFFPLSIHDCKKLITDTRLLDDMKSYPCDNLITVQALSWAVRNMSKEGLELTQFCTTKLIQSLMGTARAGCGYKNNTYAYDSGLSQIRVVPELWSTSDNEQYIRLISQLRSKMASLLYLIDSSED